MALLFCSCDKVDLESYTFDSPNEYDTNLSSHDKYAVVLEDYKQLVKDLFSADFEDKVNNGYFTSPNEDLSYDWFCMVIDAKKGLNDVSPSSFGYALYDINGDNCYELVLLRGDYFVLAIYTIFDEEPTLLGAFSHKNKAYLLGDGEVCNFISESSGCFEYSFLQIDSKKLRQNKAYGKKDSCYYELTDGEEKAITEEEFIAKMSELPSVSDQTAIKEHMAAIGVVFTPYF